MNVRAKTVKLLEENREPIHDLGIGKEFLNRTYSKEEMITQVKRSLCLIFVAITLVLVCCLGTGYDHLGSDAPSNQPTALVGGNFDTTLTPFRTLYLPCACCEGQR